MNREPWDVRAQGEWIEGPGSMAVAIFKGDAMVTDMTFQDRRGAITAPTIRASEGREFLQAALDCAWQMGLRPAGFHHTTETVAAKDRHLEDMRAIAFTKLNVEKP